MKIDIPAKLGLGSVQFGMPYGVTNRAGMPSADEVAKILQTAHDAGIRLVDTAPSYDTSEEVLGQNWPQAHEFRVVTKTPVYKKSEITASDARHLTDAFLSSLNKLRLKSAYGLLAHHASDLTTAGGEFLFDAMQDLKTRRLVEKIGASVYTGEEIERVLDRFTIDLIQLPLNVFDQRLIRSGHLRKLADKGVEIHARSVFLQGVLLADPQQLNGCFLSIQPLLRDYRDYCEMMRWSTIQGAIGFAAGLPQVDRLILGVCSQKELCELLQETRTLSWRQDADFSALACDDERIVNPSLWQLR